MADATPSPPRPLFQVSLAWLLALPALVAVLLAISLPYFQLEALKSELRARGHMAESYSIFPVLEFVILEPTDPEFDSLPLSRLSSYLSSTAELMIRHPSFADRHLDPLEIPAQGSLRVTLTPHVTEEGIRRIGKLPLASLGLSSDGPINCDWEVLGEISRPSASFDVEVPIDRVERVLEILLRGKPAGIAIHVGSRSKAAWPLDDVPDERLRLGPLGPILTDQFVLRGACLADEEVDQLRDRFDGVGFLGVTLPHLSPKTARTLGSLRSIYFLTLRVEQEVSPEAVAELTHSKIRYLTLVVPRLNADHIQAVTGATHMEQIILYETGASQLPALAAPEGFHMWQSAETHGGKTFNYIQLNPKD